MAQKNSRHNHHQIEKKGREGGKEVVSENVEDSGNQSQQAHQHDVGEHQTVELIRQGELPLNAAEAETDGPHQPWRKEDPRQGHDGHDKKKESKAGSCHPQSLLLAITMENAREGRHKGGSQGAFGKKSPQKVRNGKGHEEGIGGKSGAKKGRHHHIPGKTGHPAQTGGKSHNGCRAKNFFFFRHALPNPNRLMLWNISCDEAERMRIILP